MTKKVKIFKRSGFEKSKCRQKHVHIPHKTTIISANLSPFSKITP
ncbi:hypothetical protein predicted by Glimmer/Critica [Helicobacter pylori B8]|uniref:Uncharacterized protein n=1 Tax=Helicobacter pylori (strain B8) TaxID=693745 RepID=D7FCK7_HELP3|nr:hypothetical protein predicted by Glimmer/Critica [Helicobacter pylori B8]